MPSGVYIKTKEQADKIRDNMTGEKNPSYKHGMVKTRFYRIYHHITRRCNDSKWKDHKLYFDKGIKCGWKTFLEFKEDMYDSYQEHVEKYGEVNTSIDRLDNNGNYCKDNCRWATPLIQGNNTSRNVKVTINGETKNISEWSRIYNIDMDVIYDRINKLKWDKIKAVTFPMRCDVRKTYDNK